jgi:hypothetical protein
MTKKTAKKRTLRDARDSAMCGEILVLSCVLEEHGRSLEVTAGRLYAISERLTGIARRLHERT